MPGLEHLHAHEGVEVLLRRGSGCVQPHLLLRVGAADQDHGLGHLRRAAGRDEHAHHARVGVQRELHRGVGLGLEPRAQHRPRHALGAQPFQLVGDVGEQRVDGVLDRLVVADLDEERPPLLREQRGALALRRRVDEFADVLPRELHPHRDHLGPDPVELAVERQAEIGDDIEDRLVGADVDEERAPFLGLERVALVLRARIRCIC